MSLSKRLNVDGRKIFASINGGFANENIRRWVGAFAERVEAEGRGGAPFGGRFASTKV